MQALETVSFTADGCLSSRLENAGFAIGQKVIQQLCAGAPVF